MVFGDLEPLVLPLLSEILWGQLHNGKIRYYFSFFKNTYGEVDNQLCPQLVGITVDTFGTERISCLS